MRYGMVWNSRVVRPTRHSIGHFGLGLAHLVVKATDEYACDTKGRGPSITVKLLRVR